MTVLSAVIILAMLSTIALLIAEFGLVVHAGELDRKASDRLMTFRIGAETGTLLLLCVAVYLATD